MHTDHRTKAQVVDLLRYRQEQGQRRLDFSSSASPRPTLAAVRAFRQLTPREIAHRLQMAKHLAARNLDL